MMKRREIEGEDYGERRGSHGDVILAVQSAPLPLERAPHMRLH
jgi:hypothetical protein